MAGEKFKFYKIEEFFQDYESWSTLKQVTQTNSVSDIQSKKQIQLTLLKNDVAPGEDATCLMLIVFMTYDSFRVRFNPGKSKASEFPAVNTRAVVQDTLADLRGALSTSLPTESQFTLEVEPGTDLLTVTTKDAAGAKIMRMEIHFAPFEVTVYKHTDDATYFKVLQDDVPSFYYKKRLVFDTPTDTPTTEFSVIHAKTKPPTAKYLGFGEKGGYSLCRNTELQ